MRAAAFFVLVVAAFVPAAWAQDAGAPRQAAGCEIRGHGAVPGVRVLAHGQMRVVDLEDRDVGLTPLDRGSFVVRTLDGGDEVRGTTRAPIALVTGTRIAFGGVSIAVGAPVSDLAPTASGVRVTLALDADVRLERAHLDCAALTLHAIESAVPGSVGHAVGPVWRARADRLDVREFPDSGTDRVTLRLGDRGAHAIVERARREGWVRIAADFARAHVEGWVRDTDLVLP